MSRYSKSCHAAVGVAALALGLGACWFPTSPSSDLAAARERWNAISPSSYAITVNPECECLPEISGPVRVTVLGSVVTRSYGSSGVAVGAQYAGAFPTVDGLFAIIDAAISKATQRVSVQYDAQLGYPSQIIIGDPTVDAGITYLVSGVRIP